MFDDRMEMLDFYSQTYPVVTLPLVLLFMDLVSLFPGRGKVRES
ncbi:MAG: hypothetical protein ACOY30_12425 [Bacillota bacterium]